MSSKCPHGWSGKRKTHSGESCLKEHPETRKKFEKFGYSERGCKERNCEKGIHLSICKHFMRNKCKFNDKCRWYHPRNVTNSSQNGQESATQNASENPGPSPGGALSSGWPSQPSPWQGVPQRVQNEENNNVTFLDMHKTVLLILKTLEMGQSG